MNTDGKITINKGDNIVIHSQGLSVKGKVLTADYWGERDGWYIEIVEANIGQGYAYWKQGYDGGRVIEVNDKKVMDTNGMIDATFQLNNELALRVIEKLKENEDWIAWSFNPESLILYVATAAKNKLRLNILLKKYGDFKFK